VLVLQVLQVLQVLLVLQILQGVASLHASALTVSALSLHTLKTHHLTSVSSGSSNQLSIGMPLSTWCSEYSEYGA
jgi:hypothetical protein